VIVAVALVAAFLLVDPGDDGNGEERLDSGDPSTTAEDSPEVQEFSLSIAGVAQVTDTEIDLVRGDEVTISASGTIRDDINGHPDRFFSPEGEPDPEGLHSGDPHFGQFNHAALYGQVGDGPLFEVGESASFDVQQDGRLQLGINDGRFDDNDGSYEVVIEVTRAG
jgi:hypothetical protein